MNHYFFVGGFQSSIFVTTIKLSQMNHGQYIFKQLLQFLPRDYFEYLVKKYQGNKYVKTFSCWNHLSVMLWAQLTSRESLRDISDSLRGHKAKFHHLGFGKSVCRSTLSEANEKRELKIFQQMAQKMMEMAQKSRIDLNLLLEEDISFRVYAGDSTTIRLDKSIFWWSKIQNESGGVKIHTLFDLLASIPVCTIITGHHVRDQTIMDLFHYQKEALYVFDKAYVKLLSLLSIDQAEAYFIVRRKKRMNFEILKERHCPDPQKGVLRDLEIRLSNRWAKSRYPKPMRIIYYYSKENNQTFEFFTNQMDLDADKIAYLYKCRWQIELFFKWIKQHLRIKRFYGTSENAVKIQIYTAVITYCLVAIVEKTYELNSSPFELFRMLGVSLFEKRSLRDFLSNYEEKRDSYQNDSCQMLNLF